MPNMILVLEDEPNTFYDHKLYLEKYGYDVEVIQDAHTYLQEADERIEKISALVIDMMVPPPVSMGDILTDSGLMTGKVVLDRIRELSQDVPVLLWSLDGHLLDRVPIHEYSLVVARSKNSTRPFFLAKLLSEMIKQAESGEWDSDLFEDNTEAEAELDEKQYEDALRELRHKLAYPAEIYIFNLIKERQSADSSTVDCSSIEDDVQRIQNICKGKVEPRLEIAKVVDRLIVNVPGVKEVFEIFANRDYGDVDSDLLDTVRFILKK